MREVSAKIGGNQNDGDVPRLSHFAMLCQNLRLCLRSVERCVSENDPHLEYGISSLKQSSAFIGIIALAKTSRDQELAGETADVFDRSVRCFEQDKEIDPRLDYDAIASFRKLYAPPKQRDGVIADRRYFNFDAVHSNDRSHSGHSIHVYRNCYRATGRCPYSW